MKLNTTGCAKELQFIAGELNSFLSVREKEDELVLTAEKMAAEGYRIERTLEGVKVHFHELTDFSRALLMIAAMEPQGQRVYEKSEARSIEEFGIMLDFSRNAVMRPDAVKRFLCYAALMGYTFVGFYMEDTIEIEGEPYFGYMRGAMTLGELKELDAYASRFGMELRGYVQTLAHLNQITRYEEYQEIIDVDDILLCGEEKTYAFIERLLKTVSEAFASRKVNIGMDEAYMVGLGKYLQKNGYHNREEVILNHLGRVMEICKRYGLEPEMWSDMFFRLAYAGEYYVNDKEPVSMPDIPDGLTLAYWDYFSTDEKHYTQMLKKHQKIAKEVSFAGTAWRFTGFTPHNRYSLKTGLAATKALRESGIKRNVITCWGDNGAEASSFSLLPALYMNAEYVYAADSACTETEYEKFTVLTGLSFDDFLKIDDSNIFDENSEEHNNSSKFLLFNDPLIGIFDSLAAQEDDLGGHYEKVIEKLAPLTAHERFGYLFETQLCLCEVLKEKAALGIRLRSAYQENNREALLALAEETIPSVLKNLERFFNAFEKQWMADNKSFGFEVQCLRLGGLTKRLEYTRRVLISYLTGEQDRIEELKQPLKPFHYFNESSLYSQRYHMWRDMVTPGVMG